jgi:SAM-dependent methyltransferase
MRDLTFGPVQRADRIRVAGPLARDADGIAQLRGVLEEAGYTEVAVQDALATEVSTNRDSLELPLYIRMLPEGERLSTLIKLLLLALPVPAAEASKAFAPLPLERLEAMGVLVSADGLARSQVELVPMEGLLIACDPFTEELTRPDHVLGISPPTMALAALTVRPPVDTVLDLCTGNGVQALLAAQHSNRVVAVDLNARALRFAEFNAQLNAVSTIELREGNLFDPVEESSFDLIVCNPPYVISPDAEFIYRDSGMRGDAFCESIVRRLPGYLHEEGFAHVLASWVHSPDEDWTEPLTSWVEGNGCDAMLLRYATHEPLQYAAGWNRPLRADPTAYAAALDRWREHFDRLGVEAISWGAIILRRRAGSNWIWSYSPSSQRVSAGGEHVLRLFASQDLLADFRGDAFLDCRLELVADHRLEQTSRLEDGSASVDRVVLSLTRGLRFSVSVDGATAEVLRLLDGRRTVRDVVAQASNLVLQEMSREEFGTRAVAALRRLVELGFLVPAR